MDTLTLPADLAMTIIKLAFAAGSVYYAIRGDLKLLHFKADQAREEATACHTRLDAHIEKDH